MPVCVAAPANKIVAQPGTVTGSIGVVFGKWDLKKALGAFGINVETISVGHQTDPNSQTVPHTRLQKQAMNARIER